MASHSENEGINRKLRVVQYKTSLLNFNNDQIAMEFNEVNESNHLEFRLEKLRMPTGHKHTLNISSFKIKTFPSHPRLTQTDPSAFNDKIESLKKK